MDTAPTPDGNLMTRAEFARANGWSKSYVTKLGDAGRLVLSDDGKLVLAAESLQRIRETTGAPERASAPAVSPQYRGDRDRKEFYDAENARLDLEERVGGLLQRGDVLAVTAEAAVLMRQRLEGWRDRLAPQLAALGGNEQRIRALLHDQVHQLLQDMSRRFERLAEGKSE